MSDQAFIARLEDEKIQLDDKISKLNSFIKGDHFSSVSEIQQGLLIAQLRSMGRLDDLKHPV